MPNRQLNVMAFAGDEHSFRRADAVGHGLFAEDGLRLVGGSGDGPGRVALVPCADRDDVGLHFFHHLAGVEVVDRRNVVELVGFRHRFGVQIGQGYNVEAPGIEVPLNVGAAYAACAYDGCA